MVRKTEENWMNDMIGQQFLDDLQTEIIIIVAEE